MYLPAESGYHGGRPLDDHALAADGPLHVGANLSSPLIRSLVQDDRALGNGGRDAHADRAGKRVDQLAARYRARCQKALGQLYSHLQQEIIKAMHDLHTGLFHLIEGLDHRLGISFAGSL